MPHASFGSWTLRSIAGLVLLTTGAVGAHSSGAQATHYSHTMVESSNCRDNRDGDGGHDDRGHDSRGHDGNGHGGDGQGRHGHDDRAHDNGHNEHDNDGHDDNGHDGGNHGPGMGLRQVISVRVPRTILLRVDKLSRVTAAATNTGCQPSKQDDVFLLRPNGAIEPTTLLHIDNCEWTGDFSVPGRFQPQWCNAALHRHRVDDTQHRAKVDQLGTATVESVVVVGS
jgi:hypothetical protein